MRTFLMAVFWITNVGNVVQLLVMASAGWFLFSSDYGFFEVSIDVYVTQVVPWLQWLKQLLLAMLGEFGIWILTLPILVISPLKFIAGIVIGLWAYSVARKMPVEAAYP